MRLLTAQTTTSYQAEWGYSAAEQALCQDVIALAGQTLSEEAGTPVSRLMSPSELSLQAKASVASLDDP